MIHHLRHPYQSPEQRRHSAHMIDRPAFVDADEPAPDLERVAAAADPMSDIPGYTTPVEAWLASCQISDRMIADRKRLLDLLSIMMVSGR